MKRSNSRPPILPRLTQADIDSPLPLISRRCMTWRDALEYLDDKPGGVLTTLLIFILFAVAMWGLWAVWQLIKES